MQQGGNQGTPCKMQKWVSEGAKIKDSYNSMEAAELFCPRSCNRSKTLFKSLLFWLAGEVSEL